MDGREILTHRIEGEDRVAEVPGQVKVIRIRVGLINLRWSVHLVGHLVRFGAGAMVAGVD